VEKLWKVIGKKLKLSTTLLLSKIMVFKNNYISPVITTSVFIIFSLMIISCKECPTEPKPPNHHHWNLGLDLSIKFQGCNIVKLSLTNGDTTGIQYWDHWHLMRNQKIIADGNYFTKDTVVCDTSVSIDSSYNYQLFVYNSLSQFIDTSNVLNVQMLSATSHAFTWTVDTLGYYGILWDVFAFSENDVWAVGEIQLKDGTNINAAHWDGITWELLSIPVNILGVLRYSQLYSVYGFNSDEVYFISHTRLILWNGSEFIQKTEMWNGMDDPYYGPLLCLWGRSGSDLYAGGRNGYMVKTDGETWERIPKFTNLAIRDIVGDSNDKLWVTADNFNGDGEFYSYSGTLWDLKWCSNHPFYPFTGPLGSDYLQVDGICKIIDSHIIMMVGGNNAMVVTHSQDDFNDYDILFFLNSGWWHAISGNHINDFFGVGPLNLVTHFNGSIYQNYPELSGLGYWEGVDQVGDYVFIVGNLSVPIVARGKR